MGIPKIIHQTGPADKTKWHEKWEEWSNTWKMHFPDFEYKLWNDEMMDTFMKQNFSQFYYTKYIRYPKNIQRIDAWRYFVLLKEGGIYADLDFECFQNFFDELDQNKVNIAESPFKHWENWERVQNALIASPKHHPFWKFVIKDLLFTPITDEVLKTTGPFMLDRCINKASSDLYNILPSERFSGKEGRAIYDDTVSVHHGTYSWKYE